MIANRPSSVRVPLAASSSQVELFATGRPPTDACEPPPIDTYDQRLPAHLDTACPSLTDARHHRPRP